MKDTAIAQFIPWPDNVGDAKFVVAGPCSAESRTQMMETAAGLAAHRLSALRAGVWKPRTRPGSFEGSGSRGLEWLKRAGDSIGVPVATEVAHPRHVEQCLRHDIDILWIGARTTGDPFAVQALADALRGVDIPVLIKNPVSPDLGLWIGALERVGRAGVKKLAVIHRGFSTLRSGDYRNSPTWRIPIELRTRRPDVPLLCDPSHICGRRRLLLGVAQSAMDLLFDGLMLEVHNDPRHALSDSRQQLTPRGFDELLNRLRIKKPSATDGDSRVDMEVAALRGEIDELDKSIIDDLARRMEIVRKIGTYKKERSISSFQPGRWQEIIQSRTRQGADKGLSENFVRLIIQHVHEEALRQQGLLGTEVPPPDAL